MFTKEPVAKEEATPALKRYKDPKAADISLKDLIDKHLLLMYRETKALLTESSTGAKLSKDSALCVRDNLKLLMELKKKEKDVLDALSDEDLQKLIEGKE